MMIWHAIVLGILEGATEFLPISSTGHLIMASYVLQIPQTDFLKSFEVAIQLGSICAMIFFYRRYITYWKLYPKIIIAFFPTAVMGLLAYKIIKTFFLESLLIVAIMLIIGGIILIILNKKIETTKSQSAQLADISYRNAFFIGLFQSIAMIPGVSRSGATIVGGIFNGFDKKQAMEFSFLLAIPTMIAATGYDLFKTSVDFSSHEWTIFSIGFVVAFFSALVVIKTFLQVVQNFSFAWFGWYRIILGSIMLLALAFWV